jgi:putative transposase
MDEPQSLAHTRWDGKSHVVWIPRHRRKTLSGHRRRHPGAVRRGGARQEECQVQEGRLLPDPVPRLLSLVPKYAVAQVVGCLKGKSATHIARACFESDLDK